jgi:hypothetical protein
MRSAPREKKESSGLAEYLMETLYKLANIVILP